MRRLFENAYCCCDPYSTAPRHITLGSHCAVCNRPVCVHPACSIFYTTRLCRDCVYTHQSLLPAAVATVCRRRLTCQGPYLGPVNDGCAVPVEDVYLMQGMARAVRQDENAQKQTASDLLRPK